MPSLKRSPFALLMILLISCGAPLTQPAVIPPSETEAAGHPFEELEKLERPLVARYYRVVEYDHKNERVQHVDVQDFRYAPRQSSFSGYETWDVLKTPWPWGVPSGDKWLYVTLNRDAEIVLAMPNWAKASAWLNSWEQGSSSALNEKGDKVTYQTFRKSFPKGEISLPSVFETEYTLLIAEKGGTPSTEPDLPAGVTERPQPNETCPAWLANSWLAEGVDGRMYKTWQPQIDPVYWCYYRHEHGSDPSLVGYEPSFDYVAYYNNRQNERHEGFKGFAFKENDVGWYINVHATTGMLSRACVRFHTVVFFARDLNTGEKLLELSYKGDYGAAVSNANEDIILQPQQANCPNQKAIAQETNALKALRVFTNGKDPGDYERWRGGTNRYLGMSFPNWSAGMTIDIRNPITGCSNKACSQASLTEQSAEQRSIVFHDLSFSYNSLLDKSDGVAGDGYFYTDPYGYVQDDDSLNTLRQYINPSFSAKLDGHYSTQDAWRGLYSKSDKQPLLELEDALGEIN